MNAFAQSTQPAGSPGGAPGGRGRRSSPMSWRWGDRLALAAAWIAGISLCVIAAAIVLYMGFRGIQYLRPGLIFSRPQTSANQAGSGGFLDPLLGTIVLTIIGIALALPLALFQVPLLAVFSFTAEGGGVFGRSFIAAGTMMSLLALPSVYAATRDGLQAVPGHQREAAFALGKTRITTIRRVLLPSVRSNIATGVTLGISRIIGSTAIVLILLGETLTIETQGSVPVLNLLRGTGSSLTTYIYDNSPAGEGGAPQKAYAAAFLLLIFVLALNWIVDRIGRAQASATGVPVVGAVV